MAVRIKRKGPAKADLLTEDRYEDARYAAAGLIREQIARTRTTVTNLKTGETLGEDEIGAAAISIGPRKRRANVQGQEAKAA